MDLKKSPRVSLEKRRLTYTIVGIIVSLSLVLISFEWTTPQDQNTESAFARDIAFDLEEMVFIPREETQAKPKENLPSVMEIIDIVADDIEIEDVIFNTEVTKDTWYDFENNVFNQEEVIDEEPIPFVNVEEKPLFNGGDPITEFAKYIGRNMNYPKEAADNGVFGLVVVQFVIDETGVLTDLVVVKSAHPALDNEALRVISASPRWTPGKQRNKPVKVIYYAPINFVLN